MALNQKQQQELFKLLEKQKNSAKELNAEEEKRLKYLIEQLDVKKESLETEKKILEAKAKAGQMSQGRLEIEKGILDLEQEIVNLKKEEEKLDVEALAKLEKQLELANKLNNAVKESGEAGKNLADKIAPISNSFSRAAVASLETGQGLKGLFTAAAEHSLNFAKNISLAKVGLSGIERFISDTVQQVGALDDAAASFVRATGASRDFAYSAFETRQELGFLGITGIEATETMQGLYGSLSEFTQLSTEAQQDFTILAAQIDKLGGNAGAMSQVFTKVANTSISEAGENLRLVAGAADALGVPFDQMSSDIEGVSELFAKMGQAGMDTFLELSAAAKATGLSVQELYGIVSQYDTFENASAAAGRLNMVLGGNLIDTYSLLSASEEERIALLQDALALSGQTFEDMDRFQRIEIADALGVSLEQAAQLFQTTRGEVEKTAAELMYAGLTQEELEEKTKAAATAMDKFNVLMGNVAVFVEPVVEGLNKTIDFLLEFTDGMDASTVAISALIGGLGSAYLAAKIAGVGIGIAFKTAAASIGATAPAISAGLASIGASAGGAAAGVGTFALAALAIGAAIAAPIAAMGYFVSKIGELVAQGPEAAASLLTISGAMSTIGASLAILGNPLSIAGLFALRSVMKTATDSVGEMGEAINGLPDDQTKFVNLSTTADSLSNLMRVSATVEEAQLENVRMIIDGISSADGNQNVGRLADAISSLVNGQANTENAPIVIELDGRTLGRWVDRRTNRAFATLS